MKIYGIFINEHSSKRLLLPISVNYCGIKLFVLVICCSLFLIGSFSLGFYFRIHLHELRSGCRNCKSKVFKLYYFLMPRLMFIPKPSMEGRCKKNTAFCHRPCGHHLYCNSFFFSIFLHHPNTYHSLQILAFQGILI